MPCLTIRRFLPTLLPLLLPALALGEGLNVHLPDTLPVEMHENLRIRIYNESQYTSGNLNAPLAQLLKRHDQAGGRAFNFQALPPGNYVIIAFLDANGNYMLEEGELVAISNTVDPRLSALPEFSAAAVELPVEGLDYWLEIVTAAGR